MAVQGISWGGVLLRIALAIALVLATFNPSGNSFYHWLAAPPVGITAGKAFAAAVLLVMWVVCLRTAYVALGMVGLVLGGVLVGTFVWLLVDLHVLHTSGRATLVWIGLVAFGVVLGASLSWSLIRARVTGQIEVQ